MTPCWPSVIGVACRWPVRPAQRGRRSSVIARQHHPDQHGGAALVGFVCIQRRYGDVAVRMPTPTIAPEAVVGVTAAGHRHHGVRPKGTSAADSSASTAAVTIRAAIVGGDPNCCPQHDQAGHDSALTAMPMTRDHPTVAEPAAICSRPPPQPDTANTAINADACWQGAAQAAQAARRSDPGSDSNGEPSRSPPRTAGRKRLSDYGCASPVELMSAPRGGRVPAERTVGRCSTPHRRTRGTEVDSRADRSGPQDPGLQKSARTVRTFDLPLPGVGGQVIARTAGLEIAPWRNLAAEAISESSVQ